MRVLARAARLRRRAPVTAQLLDGHARWPRERRRAGAVCPATMIVAVLRARVLPVCGAWPHTIAVQEK
jgi:hypothetical protein